MTASGAGWERGTALTRASFAAVNAAAASGGHLSMASKLVQFLAKNGGRN